MARILKPHAITATCPLTCLEDLLPSKPFRAVSRHLADNEHFVHPVVGDVIDLYQHSGLTGIRGLGAHGVEQTTTLLETAALIPTRPHPGQQQPGPSC